MARKTALETPRTKKTDHPLQPNGKQRRGFALMDRKLVSEISRKGRKAAHVLGKAHEFTAEEAREAGRKGGYKTSQNRHRKERGDQTDSDTNNGSGRS